MRARHVVIILCLLAGVILAQVTPSFYPHPKPRPTTGNTTNTLLRISQALAPSAYQNDYPAVWAIDIGGGLHSRLNPYDRTNVSTNFTQEGALVYDASDKTYYAVGTNLVADIPLFSTAGFGTNVQTIYNSDGTITNVPTGRRVVRTGTNLLTFDATGGDWQVYNANSSGIGAKSNTLYGSDQLWLSTGKKWLLTTEKVSLGQAQLGQVLAVTNINGTTNVTMELMTPTPGTNLFVSDGALSGPRLLSGAGNDLTFNGIKTLSLVGTNSGLSAYTNLNLATPNVMYGRAQQGWALVLTNQSTGGAEYMPILQTNLYISDGTLAANRTVTANAKDFRILGGRLLQLDANDVNLSTYSNLYITTPAVRQGTVQTNWVLTVTNTSTGASEFRPALATNVYNGDGTITSTRSITVPTDMTLRMIGSGTTILNTPAITLAGVTNTMGASDKLILYSNASGQFHLRTPRFYAGTANSGDVLTLVNKADGVAQADYYPPNNLYNNNGSITGARTVSATGAGAFTFQNFSDFNLNAVTNVLINGMGQVGIYARGPLILATPKVFGTGGFPSAGWVLTLQDAASGRVEFAPSVTPTNTPATIYTADGNLGSSLLNGIRDVGIGAVTNRLVFNGYGGGSFEFYNANRFLIYAKTNQLVVPNYFEVQASAGTVFKLTTPRVATLGSANMANQILTIAADGTCDFQPFTPTGQDISIYTHDRALNANRVLSGGGFNLTFSGVGNLDLRGNTVATFGTDLGTGSLRLRTRNVAIGSGLAVGQELRMTATDGTVEFATPDNVYNNNGTLTGNRVITGNNFDFQVQGAKFAYLMGTDAGLFLTPSTAGTLRIGTPKIMTPATYGTAQIGWPLCLTNVGTGAVEFMPLYDKHLSTDDASLTGTRFIYGNGNQLNVNGTSLFDVNSTSVSIQAAQTGTMKLRTPKVTAGTAIPTYLLTYRADGTCDFDTAPGGGGSGANIYNQDGAMSGTNPRSVTGNGYTINFNDVGNFKVEARADITLDAANAGHFYFKTPKLNAGTMLSDPLFLKLKNRLTGEADWEQIDYSGIKTFYQYDGDLATSRIVTGKGNNLTFDGIGTFQVNSTIATLNGSSSATAYGASSASLRSGGTAFVSAPQILLSDLAGAGANVLVRPNNFASANVNDVLKLVDKTTGRVEFQPDQVGTGGFGSQPDYYATLDFSRPSTWTVNITANSISPPYNGSSSPPGTSAGNVSPPAYSRWLFRVNSMTENFNGASTYINWGNTSYSLCKSGSFPTANIGIREIQNGYLVETVFVPNFSPVGSGAFVMVNAGWSNSATTATSVEQATVTNRVTARVSTVSLAGVVDTFADLAEVPLTFKKVSTLGFQAQGDGQHDDYFLTNFDLSSALPPAGIQSNVDPTKMWKRLVHR